jgi:hypothetical protein
MPNFYRLDTILASNLNTFAGGQWVNDTRSRCENCGLFDRSTEPNVIEIELNYLGKNGFADFLWNSHGLPLFRDDLLQIWQDAGLTGFQTKPVSIVGWYGHPDKSLPENLPRYYRVFTVNHVRLSEPPPKGKPCKSCGSIKYAFPESGVHFAKGMAVDASTWKGADVFGVLGYEFLLCTHRAAEITLNAGYNKRIAFVKLDDWGRWDEFDIKKWTSATYRKYLERFLIRKPNELK